MKKKSTEEFDMSSPGVQVLLSSLTLQILEKIVGHAKDDDKLTMKDVNKIVNDIVVALVKSGLSKQLAAQLGKEITSNVSTQARSSSGISREQLLLTAGQNINAAKVNKEIAYSSKQVQSSPLAAAIEKELKKDVIRQEESKQLKTGMDKIQYLISGFFEDMKSSEPRKRKRFIDDLVDALGAKKTVMGVVTDIFKLLSLMSANWLRKFGTLGKVIGTALVLFGPTLGIVLGKALLNVMTKAFVGLFSFLGRSVIKVFNMGVPFGNFGKMGKAGTAAQTGAKTLGRTGIKASQLTRTVPQSTSALRSAIMLGGASAMGAGAGAKVLKVTSGAGTLAQKLGSPAMTKAATKAGGKVAAKAGGRFAALIPGAAIASGAALTALSGKMAWDSFKEGDMVGGAAFGVSTVASLVQMLAGNIPGIGTAVSAIAGAIGFIADMVGFFHKEVGEFIKGFWDNFKKGLWEGIKGFFSNSGLFGSPAEAHGIPTVSGESTPIDTTGVSGVMKTSGKLARQYKKASPERKIIADKVMAEATRQGVDPYLALALSYQESGWNQKARSKVGAIGVMQLMPGTAKSLGVNPYDVDDNIRGGIKYLKNVQAHYGNNLEAIIASYNAGIGAVDDYLHGTNKTKQNPLHRKGVMPYAGTGYKETKNYVSNILGMYYGLKGTDIGAGTPVASNKSSDLAIKKEEPKKAEAPKEDKPVKGAEEPNKNVQVLQGNFPQGTSNAQAPALPKVDFSGTRTASNILNGVTNIVNVGADAAYQIV